MGTKNWPQSLSIPSGCRRQPTFWRFSWFCIKTPSNPRGCRAEGGVKILSPICPRGDKIFLKNREIPRGCRAETGVKILSPIVTIVLQFDPVPKIRMEVWQKCHSSVTKVCHLWGITELLYFYKCNKIAAVSVTLLLHFYMCDNIVAVSVTLLSHFFPYALLLHFYMCDKIVALLL